jgi:UDP-N-acetylglucosamine 2-epimerase (non-hydrolysing)
MNNAIVPGTRPENVDIKFNLREVFEGVYKIDKEFPLPVLFSVHPRTRQRIIDSNLTIPQGIKVIEPYGYLDVLQVEEHARLVITDSGGLQDECCVLQVPCITLWENTARPELFDVGANVLVGSYPSRIIDGAREMMSKKDKGQIHLAMEKPLKELFAH